MDCYFMKTEEIILNNFQLKYPLERLALLSDILFLDIETTGFLTGSSSIYLIGCAYYEDGNWKLRQWFAQTPDEESEILSAFLVYAAAYLKTGDIRGMLDEMYRSLQYGIFYTLSSRKGLDIFRRITPYKNFLKLPDCKLKTIESFLGIHREDIYTGGQLIQVYHDYTSSHDYDLYHTLILHNADDMKGMLETLPILSYYDLFNCSIKASKAQTNYYNDMHGVPRKELIIRLIFVSPLPVAISFMGKGCHFKAEGYEGTLVIPIYEEELKYYYANYKDYYYLPLEDTALHKSIASFVDKDYREQATARNCYTRKISLYLPQWKVMVEPFFKRDYDSKDLFFELTDDIKKDRQLFSDYASHVLNAIAFQD